MQWLIDALQRLFLFGRGRPVALVILIWLTNLSVLSEMPQEDSLAEISGSVARPFASARQFLFDSYQKYHPREPRSQPVTIVEIDEASLAKIGQWPWPRNKLAELVDAIAAHQPAATGFDMYMPERDQTSPEQVAENLPPGTAAKLRTQLAEIPGHDALLAQSLRNTPSVLGAAGFDFTTQTSSAGLRTAALRVSGGDARPYVRRFATVLASLPKLQAAAWGQGILSVDLEFGVVRRIPLVVAVGDELVSGFAMEMLRVATGSSAVELEVGEQGITHVSVADLKVPTQSGGEIWLHYARSKDTAGRYVSAVDIMEGKVEPELLSGKLVLLGLTGSGLQDMRTTALRELVPGIEVHAQVLETLFDGRFLLRPWWIKWLEIGVILSLGSYLVWFVPRTDSRLASFLKTVPRASLWLTLALNGVLISAGYLLFRYQGILFDASSFFIILSGTMGSLVSSAMIEIDRETREQGEALQGRRELAHQGAGKLLSLIDNNDEQCIDQREMRAASLTRALAEAVSRHPELSPELSLQEIEVLCAVAPLRNFGLPPVSIMPQRDVEQPARVSRRLMQEHCELGGIALVVLREALGERGLDPESNAHLRCLSQLLEGQYEWWNGDGYPLGTAGEAIPIAARIVALSDAYANLRYGESSMSHGEATQIIRAAAGAQFDPRIVDCFEVAVSVQSGNKGAGEVYV